MNAPSLDSLAQIALAARDRAHAPYSHFRVGAAVESISGATYPGCNVENASYGLAICAERVAISNMIVSGDQQIRRLVIASVGAVAPCGACRQFISEFCDDCEIVLLDPDKPSELKTHMLSALLPLQFGSVDL